MFKKCFAIVAAVLFVGSSFAATPAINTISTPDSLKEVATPEAKYVKPAIPAWTIMVFINAKNNLEQFGLKDVNEMEMVGSNEKVNVVVELGRMRGFSSAEGDWTGSRRYLVQKDENPNLITSPILQNDAKADMGDWNRLVDFGKWAKTNYPAQHYMLVVWNHGAGWVKRPGAKGISYDDETGNHMSTPQLAQAIKAIGGVDVYGSDACLMQMASVDYEIKDSVTYIVGSEETEPGDGYTYDLMLNQINASSLSPFAVGKAVVNAYSDHYASIRQSSTQSLVKAASMGKFVELLNAFVDAVMASNDKAGVKAARTQTSAYAYADNKDLHHFVANLLATTKDENVKATGAALNTFITRSLVVHNRTNTFASGWDTKDYSKSMGMAIYFPNYGYNADYNSLQFGSASKWPAFIQWVNGK